MLKNIDLELVVKLRVKLLTSNTVAQARAYALLVEAVCTVLIGLRPIHTARKQHKPVRGLFGLASAFYGVTEVQSRNALHAHMVLWVRSLDPRMIEKVAHDPEVRARIIHKIESIVSATSEGFEHVYKSPPPASEGGDFKAPSHPGEAPWIFTSSRVPIHVGDEFYDCADSTCKDHLGWVRVVKRRCNGFVWLRPICRPSHRSRSGSLVQSNFKTRKQIHSNALAIAIEDADGNPVWQWCETSVKKAKAMTQLFQHGHKVKSEYNTHVHTFTCHKCNDTYRAKHCRMGFPRRLMSESKLSQVVESETDLRKAIAAPNIDTPDSRPKKSVICFDLKRRGGWNEAVPKGFSKRLLPFLRQYCVHTMQRLSTGAAQNVMEFLYGDTAFCYGDGYQCETSIILAALLGCNTNASPLGSRAQAICAMYYLAGYLSKNPVKPHHWASCIAAARKAASRMTSKADDAGTSLRNCIFLLQKVLNRLNAMGEVSDTQSAMLLLGEPSFVSSHRFRFVFVHSAVEFQMSLRSSTGCDEVDIDDDSLSGSGPEWSHPSTIESAGSVVATPSQEEAPVQVRGQWMYTDHDGTVVALDQHDHYLHRCRDWDAVIPGVGVPTLEWWFHNSRGVRDAAWRRVEGDRGLELLNFNEYVRHVTVVPMPTDRTNLYTSSTRYYQFNEDHPLHKSHVQQLSQIAFVTTVSGKRPNPPRSKRPTKPGALAKWQRTADFYGVFMGTLLSPWDRHGDCGVHNWEDYQCFMNNLKSRSQRKARESWTEYIYRSRTHDGRDVPSPEYDFPDPSLEHTIDYADCLTDNLRVPEAIKILANDWRYGTADKFTAEAVARAVSHANSHAHDNAVAEDNAIAIARLIDNTTTGGPSAGIRPETQAHLNQITDQLQTLFPEVRHRRSTPTVTGLDVNWSQSCDFTSSKWADAVVNELLAREAPPEEQADVERLRNDLTDRMDFSDLREGNPLSTIEEDQHALSPDQAAIFDHAVEKFQKNEQLLLFVHGPPGTGKTLLANRIMKAANRLGIGSKFAACTGAAASINGGCTLHYLANLGVKLPHANQHVTANQVQVHK